MCEHFFAHICSWDVTLLFNGGEYGRQSSSTSWRFLISSSALCNEAPVLQVRSCDPQKWRSCVDRRPTSPTSRPRALAAAACDVCTYQMETSPVAQRTIYSLIGCGSLDIFPLPSLARSQPILAGSHVKHAMLPFN